MVAIRLPQTDAAAWVDAPTPRLPTRPTLAPVPSRRPAPVRRLPDRATRYRRRRLAVLVTGTLTVASFVVAADYLTSLAGRDGRPAPIDAGPVGGIDPAAAGPAPAAAAGVPYIVQPGDTLWSIAAALAPGHDPRPIVDHLRAANGGRPLQAGDRLILDLDGVR